MKGNLSRIRGHPHLKETHDDSHGCLVVAIAGGGGGGRVVLPGVEGALHDLVAQSHVPRVRPARVVAVLTLALPASVVGQAKKGAKSCSALQTCFAPAVGSLFDYSSRHLLLLDSDLAPGSVLDPDPGPDLVLDPDLDLGPGLEHGLAPGQGVD